jgi:hypothetical protein
LVSSENAAPLDRTVEPSTKDPATQLTNGEHFNGSALRKAHPLCLPAVSLPVP